MPAVALSPKAGAHGELCGLMAIRAAHEASGQHEKRRKVLVPTSAHGTNPATAAFVGYSVVEVAQTEDGRVDVADLASSWVTMSPPSWSRTPTPAACSSATS